MDIEQILTQVLIVVFTVLFFIFASRVKSSIEKRYRKGTENLKHSKQKIKEITVKQTILCKKVLFESTNRHHRSIIAASLKQTLDEEMEKLEHINDSIKLVQQIPDLKPSFHQFDNGFFKDFGGLSVFNLCSNDANGDKNEKCLVRGKDGRLQTRLCNARRAKSRRIIKNDKVQVKNESMKKWNACKDRYNINGQFPQPIDKQIQVPKDFMVYNIKFVNSRDNHIKSIKETLDMIMEVESSENLNEYVKTLPDPNSNIDETMQDLTHKIYFNDLFNSEEKQGVWDPYSYFNNKTNNSNKADVSSERSMFTALDENHKTKNQMFLEKGISCRQIRHKTTKNGKNRAFQFELTFCSENAPGLKVMIEHKNNKSDVIYNAAEESLKVINIKMFQVNNKQIGNNTNTLVRYVLKVSIKINKKKVVLKCIVSCFDKEKRYNNQLRYTAKRHSLKQLQSNTSCSIVESNRIFTRKPNNKRHSLYTNTSSISKEKSKIKCGDNTYHSLPGAEGDITLTASSRKRKGSILHRFEDQVDEADRAIIKQCVQLTNNHCTDYSELFYAGATPLMHHRPLLGNEMLPTIEEEITGSSEESLEKINAKVCPPIKFENKNYRQRKDQTLVGRLGINDSEQPLPLLCKESNVYGDQSRTHSDIHTALNLKVSEILEKINAIKIKENNTIRPNTAQPPTSLTCIFELRSFDETMYTQNICMNRFYNEMFNKEACTSAHNIFHSGHPSSINYSASCTSINSKDQVKEIQPLYDLETITHENEVVLENTTVTNALFTKDTVDLFMNNEFDELYFKPQGTSSAVVIMEGAVFSSSNNSASTIWDENESETDNSPIMIWDENKTDNSATMIWDENESDTDLSDDKLSTTSESI